ncbi:hypothetical protein ITJ86_04145 [Winogradskyella sp. F6397]|uniref:Uncharacterized protein n=1 Tax=Winogradskyella marina TaxID=2785530 RepID=A0ABS0EF70_9FLAO|nr:hypothetical protein [Winogradskyella marina]MBF8149072.1 hypothetical protein [Winogradskyella marina]
MTEKLSQEINSKGVHYGDNCKKIMDLFSRQEEKGSNITKKDDKFFSMLWQAFAWAAIIGFRNEKTLKGADLKHKTSFKFQTITNSSERIANSLLLMALGKIKGETAEEILNSRKLLTIIGEHAEGGAKHILELRETQGFETKFNYSDDFFLEIYERNSSAN